MTGRAVQVAVADGVLGVYLVDGVGRTLYVFDGDATETSTCLDACTVAWPPLVTGGAATAGEGAAGGPLTTTTRPDGSRQVVYGRHPLYYSATDTAPGHLTGQGSGGTWWIIGPDAQPIRTAPGSAIPSPTTG